jgi:hypothetical protein
VRADLDPLARGNVLGVPIGRRTLKAMTIAFDADASSTSDSFTAPTPEWMMRIFTFSSDSFVSVSASTSAEPCTSLLMMIGSSFMPPSAICACSDSSVSRPLSIERPCLRLLLAERGDLAGLRGVGHLAYVAGLRQPREAEHFDRCRWSGRTRRLAAVVDEGADAADDRAGDERVADVERAVLHEHRATCPRPLSSLASRTVPVAVRFGLAQFEDVTRQEDHLEQQVDILLLARRHER